MAIKNASNNKNIMLTNKNSKFLFYNFNNYLNRRGLPVQYLRLTIISEDIHRLIELQKKDWQYFIGKLFELSEKENFNLENLGTEADLKKISYFFTLLLICRFAKRSTTLSVTWLEIICRR